MSSYRLMTIKITTTGRVGSWIMMPSMPSASKQPSSSAAAPLQQPLEELGEATKAAIDRGKQRMKRARTKVKRRVDSVQEVVWASVGNNNDDDDAVGGSNDSVKQDPRTDSIMKEDALSYDQDSSAEISSEGTSKEATHQSDINATDTESDIITTNTNSKAATSSPVSMEIILTIYTAILATYQAWSFKSEILANQHMPLSVVFPLLVVAFLIGYNLDGFLSRGSSDKKHPGDLTKDDVKSHEQRGEMNIASTKYRDAQISTESKDEDAIQAAYDVSLTRQLVRRGKDHIKSFGRRYIKQHIRSSGLVNKNQQYFWSSLSNLKGADAKLWEKKLKAPLFSEGPLMDHLLQYQDFRRHRSGKKASTDRADTADSAASRQESMAISEGDAKLKDESIIKDITIGHAKLQNTKAESLESNEQFSHFVVPLCDLRGMDLFLTDDPEEHIWRQPLLNECGLRDTPTFIANMMMPFGNMTAYFKLPDWVDNWNDIPEEKDDDPPEVKALKRFLLGDDEYRNARLKVIPFIVDGPLAIRLIKPKPVEIDLHGRRHPCSWSRVEKSADPISGKTSAAILEVDIDLFSEKTIRKVINIVRPHIAKITIDIALIISKPQDSEMEEPSACLGLWRIENVDFEDCAVFPELTVREAAKEISILMSMIEAD